MRSVLEEAVLDLLIDHKGHAGTLRLEVEDDSLRVELLDED